MLSLLQNNTIRCARNCLLALSMMMPVWVSAQVDEQYLAGNAWLIKGDYTRAVESLTLAINRNNSDDQLYIKRGSALLNNNETQKAIADFNEANLIRSQVADIWLARAFSMEGEGVKAIAALKDHLNSPFRLPEDSIKKDPAFNSIQESPEWHALWQKDWYSAGEKAMADAEFYVKKQQYDQAVTRLDEAIMNNPGEAGLLLSRGKVFTKQGNYAAAAGDFSSAVNADKSIPGTYAQRGYAYLKSERYKDAVNDFNRAIREDPSNFRLYQRRAEAFAGQMNWSSAIKDMLLYMKYFDNDLQALYQCGEYYFASEDYMNALKCFNRNLKEDPNNAVYYKARGKAYVRTATYRYAISDLSMSLDLDPTDAETWMYHGLAAIKTGDKVSGCSSLQKAQKMGNAEAVRHVVENCREE